MRSRTEVKRGAFLVWCEDPRPSGSDYHPHIHTYAHAPDGPELLSPLQAWMEWAAHSFPAVSGPRIWINLQCWPVIPGWHGFSCASLAAVGLSALLCLLHLLQVRGA